MPRYCLALLTVLLASAKTAAFELRDGDRVVLLGGTWIEREQRYGYWETALTSLWPERNVIFRNLGWSGDTVWGESRAGFDAPAQGYRRLVERTLAEKPTVIFLGYGTNESFAGAAGLPRFREQLNKLLDDLAPAKARIVLLAPLMIEEAAWKGGDREQRRQDLQRYTEALRAVAKQRELHFADEFCQRYGDAARQTDNGMHLTEVGYWSTAWNLLTELKAPVRVLEEVTLDGMVERRVLQKWLPNPPGPPEKPATHMQSDCKVIARNLKPGRYTLRIDGRAVHTEDAATWMKPPFQVGVLVPRGPSLDQAERLRRAIVAKNQFYFHRWRPQNETYLFGFRKHEQGQNAKEIPQFDPLVEKLEKEIARLRRPVAHTYQLVPAEGDKK